MLPPSREALKGSNIMERHQRSFHPKQLDDQAPTRAIEHDAFHNDAHSIRTENRGKPERYGEWGTLFFALITWAAGRDSFSPDHRPGFAAGAVPPWRPPPASQRNDAPA